MMNQGEREVANRRIAEAVGWTALVRYDGRWFGKAPGDTSPGNEHIDLFTTDPAAALEASKVIVKAFELVYSHKAVPFVWLARPVLNNEHLMDVADDPAEALALMCVAVLDAKENKGE